MEVSADMWYTRNAAPSVFTSHPTGMLSPFPEAFGHDGDTDSEDEFPSLSTAPVAKKKWNRPSVEQLIPEGSAPISDTRKSSNSKGFELEDCDVEM